MSKITIPTTTVFLGPRGVEKGQFQQSASTQSGGGEKDALNIKLWEKR